MAEDLQNLLDRIRKDTVEKADAQAAEILKKAEAKAEACLSEAESRAKALREEAEKDAAAFVERAKVSLQQASRDVVLSVGQAMQAVLREIAGRAVTKAMDPDTLRRMLVKLVEAYTRQATEGTGIEILLSPGDREKIADHFMSEFAGALKKGVEVRPDKGILAGFRVGVVGEDVQHDFSAGAVADAMCELLRPELGEIVRNAIEDELLLPGGKSADADNRG